MASSENSSSDDNYNFSGSQEVNMKESGIHFSKDEVALIIRMYKLVGQRWTLIAGRIPGRTAEEIEKYWQSRYSTNGDDTCYGTIPALSQGMFCGPAKSVFTIILLSNVQKKKI
ncbi:MYB transcription factor MYB172 [Striga asiatica]|uniref:MYB transcription factor MYB172 n=1 Tax=Striga asiatica TaxID=4170 RepID=A0A5A7R5L4_STRAF|nr:MYB transcription factor MYB172 [Striga asiatica]